MRTFSDMRIFVCTSPIRINLSFDGLMGLAQEVFGERPAVP